MSKNKNSTMKKKLAALKKARAARKRNAALRLKKAVTKTAKTAKPVKKKKTDVIVGFTSEVYRPVQLGRSYGLLTTKSDTLDKVKGITEAKIKKALAEKKAIRAFVNKSANTQYKLVNENEFKSVTSSLEDSSVSNSAEEAFETHEHLMDFVHKDSLQLLPAGLYIEDLKWKYLVRSAVRGRNIMLLGPTGCGKTLAAQSLVRALKRPDYYFNLGATQDPRATLIGNTHFNKLTGTFFSESAFVKAIKTPYAIILLDEISRAHPEAWNILMSVLDQNQRYLRLDEAEGAPIVKVATGVTFVATANVGNEYTSTRIMDRAMMDRFANIDMGLLNKDNEYALLKFKFPHADDYSLTSLAEIASVTRDMVKTSTSKITTSVSTRANVEAAGLVYDGFTLIEACEIAILPFYSTDGDMDSERTFMKQLIQKYVRVEAAKPKATAADSIEHIDGQKIQW